MLYAYPIIFKNADGTTVNGELVTDMTLANEYWTLVPAANGTEYSGYPTGAIPVPPTWSTVPNLLNQSTSYSVNVLTTYITPTSGCTCVLNGSLPTGWTFDGTTLAYNGSGVGGPSTVSFTAKLTSSGLTSNSNSFSVQGVGSPSGDTVAPTVPVNLNIQSNTVAGGIVLSGITPSDPNINAYTWSGLKQINITRTPPGSVIGDTLAGPGNQPILVPADIGGPYTPASTITQTGADVAFTTVAQDNPYPTNDGLATDFQQLFGTNWWATCKISAFAAANAFATVGLYARTSMAATSAFVATLTFPFSQGNGCLSKARPASGGNGAGINTIANTIAPVWLVLNRNADTYYFYYSIDGNTLISLGSTTQAMGSPLYVGVAANSGSGTSISVTAQQVSIQTSANWTYTDSTVAQGTSYQYSATSQDVAGNVSAAGANVSVTSASTSHHAVNWNPGFYMASAAYTLYGNSQASLKSTEIAVMRAGPAFVKGWEGFYTYAALFNSGSFDGSDTGGGFDTDYKNVTGYVSGSKGSAVYTIPTGRTKPPSMGIYLNNTSYNNSNPVGVVPSVWMTSSYGSSPSGSGGWWTTTPNGHSTTIAWWRPSVQAGMATFYQAMANHILPDGWTVATSPYIEWVKLMQETCDFPEDAGGTSNTDSSFNEANYVTALEAVISGASSVFPTTSIVLTYNYLGPSDSQSQGKTLMAAMKSNYNNVGDGGPDIFGNGSQTTGQQVYNGTIGGIDYRLVIPYRGTVEDSEFAYGLNQTTVAAIIVAANNNLKATDCAVQCHISGVTGSSGTVNGVTYNGAYSALWYGSASSIAQWLTNPGTFSGVLDAMYNVPLTNAAYPTNFP